MHLSYALLTTIGFFLFETHARDVVGEFEINKDSCWDVGYVDYLSSAGECQLQCSLTENCNSWGYNFRGSRRCHLCSWTYPRTDVECDTVEPCKIWGVREEGVNAVSVLNQGIQKANKVCEGTLNSEEALSVAQDLNLIVQLYENGDFNSSESFIANLPTAGDNASMVLQREKKSCRNDYTGAVHSCKYGSLVLHQLRALLLNVDNGNGKRAFPKKKDRFRKRLLNKYGILLADNRWMNDATIEKLIAFYAQLPPHLSSEGILYDALYATQTVKDAWNCNGSFPGYLGTTKRGFNVFKTQVGQLFEQAFPDDTPNQPPQFDLQMTVTRHEATHQFDRIIFNRANDGDDSRLYDMKLMLTQASAGDDKNWLRSQVGDAYFQGAPQEIMASQIGNQYLASTSSQLRLAAARLMNDSDWTAWTYSDVAEGIAELTRENRECVSQSTNLGSFGSAQECVEAAMNDDSCAYEIMFSSAYPSWGCRCCKPFDDASCPDEAALYTSHDLWDIYQYSNSVSEPSCTSIGGTGIPLSWFLFNVEIFTPVSSQISTFYENEVGGQVTPIEVLVSRDTDTNGIVLLDIPFCGIISFEYGEDGIVNSVSSNAASCTFLCKDDVNFRIVKKSGAEKNCAWVGMKPSARCKRIGKDGRKASHVCLASCGKCS